ncbi:pyruvate carboxylase subunit B [Micrococcus sp. TA1]|uniref:pyruvate carboxylase subunit B n=1 Tax=Micrococcus sp. TA1 TaxID=681627 RepID=UPI0017BD87BD|nr:pyruvate carboxylase subunit B [Micrococcus sp. TA1]MBB5750292.1 oxaloacetate decarboxylase alpha subunit [Micrococcus sp. TA1]
MDATETIASVMSVGGRPAGSRREIKIIDTTLRDAHQSIWATRMRTEHIEQMVADFDQVGFEHVDLVAPIQFDVAVRYLKEDPWERVRRAHELAPTTTFRALIRSRNIAAFDFLPDDVIMAWVERLYANGFRAIGSFDGLNDIDNIAPGLRHAKRLGAETFGAVAFCESPVHTDELFVAKATELIEKADVDRIMLKDAGGLLTPERIRTLVPALKDVIGNRPLEVHTHSLTGLAPLVCLEAAEAGADSLHLSVAPLAAGNGQPSVQNVVRDLRALGYVVNVDDGKIDEISETIRQIAEHEGKPLGEPVEYNGLHFMHQTPGGMLSNFRTQLATAGLADRYEELLHEIARVRSELAYPIMITPFAQFVGTQAAMNVMTGERYKMVPNEIKKYVLGYYGDLLADIDPELRQRIIDNGASDIALEPSEPAPMLQDLAARHPEESIDHHLLRAMFAGSQVDEMKKAVASGGNPDEVPHPLLGIVKALHATGQTGTKTLNAGDLKISITQGEN